MEKCKDKLFVVGAYNFDNFLSVEVEDKYIYQSNGLKIHIRKRHPEHEKYIDRVSEIIKNPDYIGINPNEKVPSLELIKEFDENILIGIKLDVEKNYLYVSTLHDINASKIERRLHSGRLKKYSE